MRTDRPPLAKTDISPVRIDLDAEVSGRLDRALAKRAPQFSRARLQALMKQGSLTLEGRPVADPAAPAVPGRYLLAVPEPQPAEPSSEAIALLVLFEDAHLIVIDKPAGMSVHPACRAATIAGTLVNALLHHCGDTLSGIGGVARPGIVHRLDKNTSGAMVAAKSDAAHRGLSVLFAAHDLDREYLALTRGVPTPRSAVAIIHSDLGHSFEPRPQENGCIDFGRPQGGHPLSRSQGVRPVQQTFGGARLVPAGDRTHASDSRPSCSSRRSVSG